MRRITLTAAVTSLLLSLSCVTPGSAGVAAPPRPAETPQPAASPQGLDPESIARLKKFLFGDLPLEELLEGVETDGEPWRHYASAVSNSKRGKNEEAKKDLRRALATPDPETRTLLFTWTALRALGERPPAATAERVQGVVCELHNEAGVSTLAAYADGRARWYGGRGAGLFWDVPGAEKVDALVAKLLRAAEPLVRKAPAAERHTPSEPPRDHFRMSVLTFGGIHVVEVFGPTITREHFAAPALLASVELLNAMYEQSEKERQKPNANK